MVQVGILLALCAPGCSHQARPALLHSTCHSAPCIAQITIIAPERPLDFLGEGAQWEIAGRTLRFVEVRGGRACGWLLRLPEAGMCIGTAACSIILASVHCKTPSKH